MNYEEPSIADQARFYDERWAAEEYANQLKLARCVAILDALCSLKVERPTVAELGCGTGWLTSILGQFGPALGVELSPAAVDAARERYPHAAFEAVDLTDWQPPAGRFEVVVSHEVLEHLVDQQAHLDQVATMLKPGGHLILTTPNLRTMSAMDDEGQGTWSTQPIENWVSAPTLRSLTRAAGLEVVRMTTLVPGHGVKGSYRMVNSTKLTAILRGLGAFPAWNGLRLSMGYGLHHLLVATRPA